MILHLNQFFRESNYSEDLTEHQQAPPPKPSSKSSNKNKKKDRKASRDFAELELSPQKQPILNSNSSKQNATAKSAGVTSNGVPVSLNSVAVTSSETIVNNTHQVNTMYNLFKLSFC